MNVDLHPNKKRAQSLCYAYVFANRCRFFFLFALTQSGSMLGLCNDTCYYSHGTAGAVQWWRATGHGAWPHRYNLRVQSVNDRLERIPQMLAHSWSTGGRRSLFSLKRAGWDRGIYIVVSLAACGRLYVYREIGARLFSEVLSKRSRGIRPSCIRYILVKRKDVGRVIKQEKRWPEVLWNLSP